MLVRQKGVNQIKRRLADGTVRIYYYHRETGLRLPDDPTSPDFAARLKDLNQPSLATEWPARSVGALVAAYKASPDFRQLAPVSQKDYSRYIDIVLEMWGNLPTAGIERRHVLTARDKFADRPRSANYLTQIIRRLLSFAVERGWRADNPATRPRMLKTGDGYRAWTADEIESFRKHHSAGTAMRTAFELGIGTGQRQADIMGMPWSAYDGSGIRVRQSKTGARLFVPCPKTLREYLTKIGLDKKSLLILARQDGAAYKADHFRHEFAEAIKDAGLGGAGLVFHGLRHTAATELANAGCDAEMVRSITGHSSLSMVQHYTKGADQERRARAAITRLDRSRVPKQGK